MHKQHPGPLTPIGDMLAKFPDRLSDHAISAQRWTVKQLTEDRAMWGRNKAGWYIIATEQGDHEVSWLGPYQRAPDAQYIVDTHNGGLTHA